MLSFRFSPFPELHTDRLFLKQMTQADAPALFALRSNPDVMKHIGRPLATTVDDALALLKVISDGIAANEAITWGIFTKEEPLRLMGTIGFWQVQKEHYRAEIGYLLHPSLHGKGLMKEAVAEVLRYGFNQMNLHSVEANTAPENAASQKLLERCGFAKEGHFRESYFFNGRFCDTATFSLLAQDFK